MQPLDWHLINTQGLEAVPARLLRARANAHARTLAQAQWLVRRKRDGRFLGAIAQGRLRPLSPALWREPGLGELLDALGAAPERAGLAPSLPLEGLRERLHQLGLDASYGDTTGLALVAEPARLEFAGRDRYRRPLWLLAPAARAWRRMQAAAVTEGVVLQAISGYRSHDYQLGIFERKLARGLTLADILAVNAAPGYSEHHGGCTMDISTPGEPAAEESFETTPAFAWLCRRAGDFGFVMSYPRGNPHGIVYEPWHWRWHAGPRDAGAAVNPASA
ncbi:M15 family metallopeptidase [Arenimonas sp. MALMAid1274]|uniref:M15 family metallopeptidase n=1 Tax=Arenimonas sp. MALMAid1274 TaxID=3411630 RepID=UPI003B9E1278